MLVNDFSFKTCWNSVGAQWGLLDLLWGDFLVPHLCWIPAASLGSGASQPRASWVCGLRPTLTSLACHFCLTLYKLGCGALGSVLASSFFGVPHYARHDWTQLWKKLDCMCSLTFIHIHIPESLCESSAHPETDITAIRWGPNPTAKMNLK